MVIILLYMCITSAFVQLKFTICNANYISTLKKNRRECKEQLNTYSYNVSYHMAKILERTKLTLGEEQKQKKSASNGLSGPAALYRPAVRLLNLCLHSVCLYPIGLGNLRVVLLLLSTKPICLCFLVSKR